MITDVQLSQRVRESASDEEKLALLDRGVSENWRQRAYSKKKNELLFGGRSYSNSSTTQTAGISKNVWLKKPELQNMHHAVCSCACRIVHICHFDNAILINNNTAARRRTLLVGLLDSIPTCCRL